MYTLSQPPPKKQDTQTLACNASSGAATQSADPRVKAEIPTEPRNPPFAPDLTGDSLVEPSGQSNWSEVQEQKGFQLANLFKDATPEMLEKAVEASLGLLDSIKSL